MRLADTARLQGGVFSRRQALAGGVSAKLVRRRRAVISHRSAAQAWGMPVSAPSRPEVSVPKGSHPSPGPQINVRAIDVAPDEVQSHHGLPVTSRQRTVVDCLLTLPPHTAAPCLTASYNSVGSNCPASCKPCMPPEAGMEPPEPEQFSLAPTRELPPRLNASHRRCSPEVGSPAGSPGTHCAPAGVWWPTLDLAFPDVLLAIEIDGWAWHTDPDRFRDDRRRQNALVTAGWMVLRFT